MAGISEPRYKQDYIADYARRKATLVNCVRNDPIDHGGTLVFLIAGDGGTSTVTRGANGLIPPSDDTQSQVTVTLFEDISLSEKTSFNIFTSQASVQQAGLMRVNNLAKVHRKQDARIIAALETGTGTLGAIASMSKQVANQIAVKLKNANVGFDDDERSNIFVALTPAAYAELSDEASFASADYVNFSGESPTQAGMPAGGVFKRWMGMNWCEHTGLTGITTSSATCLAWHRDAVGFATGTRGIDVALGYDSKQDSTYARATVFQGAVKLQNAGIVKFTHDDTGLS